MGVNVNSDVMLFGSMLLIGCLIMIIVLLILTIVLFVKLGNMKKRYNKMMTNTNGENIESAIIGCVEKIDALRLSNNEHESKLARLFKEIKCCTQKVAVVRYNAFDNVGSDQSFSIALLDQNNDGFVISGIYTRNGSSTYAKPIKNSISKHPLSAEEIQAIENAKKTFGDN